MKRTYQFQSLVADLSATLIKADPERIDQLIPPTLRRIGEDYALDRIGVTWLVESGEATRRSHVWHRGEPLNMPEQTDIVDIPWIGSRVVDGVVTKVETVADLPAEAELERRLLETYGVKSILVLPLKTEEGLVGAVSFQTLRQQRQWTEETVEELRFASEIVACAFTRFIAITALRWKERNLTRAQGVAHVGSYIYFPPSGKTELSEESLSIIGCDPAEASLEYLTSAIHPEDRERYAREVERALEKDALLETEYRVVRRDGSIRNVRDRAHIERDSEGKPALVSGTFLDITRQKETEAALKSSLAELKQMKERVEAENIYLREEVRLAHGFGKIVGESDSMKRCLSQVERVAPTDSTVLVLGETGTGKELIARRIHDLSKRNSEALVSVNCAALPGNLIESELFGHEKGAFTGAQLRKRGRFELADGGTLLLDEIGDLPLELQGKLLRVLQEGEFDRLGSTETLRVNVRVIAATNRDLARLVEHGGFREDLYYRLNVYPILLPPLRERKEDIPILTMHFVVKHARRLGREIESVAVRLMDYLTDCAWPGNVRELENFIERALIASEGPVLDIDGVLDAGQTTRDGAPLPLDPILLRDVERAHILDTLEKAGWVIEGEKGAASRLGIRPSTLRSKLKKLGIVRPR